MDDLQQIRLMFMAMLMIYIIFFGNNQVEQNDDELNECLMTYLHTRVFRDEPIRIKNYVRLTVMNMSELGFQQHFRMSTTAFNWLFRKLSPWLSSPRISGRQTIRKMEKLPAVLWLLATPDSYRSVAERFDMSKSDLFEAFLKVLTALNAIAPRIIVWPNAERRRIIERNFMEKAGIFGVVGAIDGTYVRIKKPSDHAEAYNNRKCFYSFTLQGICDHDLLFTDVFTGYPSAVSDIRIFRNSDIYSHFLNNHDSHFDEHQFILGDKAYPLQTWCITPYVAHRVLTPRQRNFNAKHAKTRVCIENAWALLYGRYRRLRYLDMTRTDLIPATILACCVLHNICRRDPNDLAEIYDGEGRLHYENIRDDEDGADAMELEMDKQQAIELRDHIADALYQLRLEENI